MLFNQFCVIIPKQCGRYIHTLHLSCVLSIWNLPRDVTWLVEMEKKKKLFTWREVLKVLPREASIVEQNYFLWSASWILLNFCERFLLHVNLKYFPDKLFLWYISMDRYENVNSLNFVNLYVYVNVMCIRSILCLSIWGVKIMMTGKRLNFCRNTLIHLFYCFRIGFDYFRLI